LEIDGVSVRVWEGATDEGGVCYVFVHRIAVPTGEAILSEECDRELLEQRQPNSRMRWYGE
jgi:hypothetical protein